MHREFCETMKKSLYLLVIFSIATLGCETQNPLCTDNYCVTGEIFPKSELGEGVDYGTLPLDESALLDAFENPPPGDMIAKNVPSYRDWAATDSGSKEEFAVYEQATRLVEGLILPPNTIAVNEDITVLIAHRPTDGKVAVFIIGDSGWSSKSNVLAVDEVGVVLVKHGHNWVLERYTPDETIPDEDEYERFDGLVITKAGTVTFTVNRFRNIAGAGRCSRFDRVNLNGVVYDVHNFEWQYRKDADSSWSTVAGTQESRGICGYKPENDGQYRAILDITIGVNRYKYASNTITL